MSPELRAELLALLADLEQRHGALVLAVVGTTAEVGSTVMASDDITPRQAAAGLRNLAASLEAAVRQQN